MITLYTLLKTLHILAAIVALGFNLTYPLWLFKGKQNDNHLLFALKGIQTMDDKFANPGYILSLVTGIILCFVGHLNILHSFWLIASLILFALAATAGIALYSPTLKRQIAVLQLEGSHSPAYKKLDKKGNIIGGFIFLMAIIIIFLMVTKP